MAAGDVARVIRAPGRLVVSPTNLSMAYPHGGIEVGKTRLVVLQNLGSSFRVEAESLGEASDVLEGSHRWVLSCFLRGWDDDAVAQLFADNVGVGAVSAHARFDVPARARPGASALGRARVLLYVPDDPVHSPSVLVYRGVPDWSEGSELAWQRQEELGIPLAVECVRDDFDRILSIARLADLSLEVTLP